MKKTSTLIIVPVIGLALLASLSARALAGTVEVGTCKSGFVQFPTIQGAVNASPAGTTILVCPGTYPEQVLINKALTVKGIADPVSFAAAAVLVAPTGGIVQNATSLSSGKPIGAQIAVVQPPTGMVNISNLTVDGNNSTITCGPPTLVGILFQNASGTISHVQAINQTLGPNNGCQNGLGIFVQSGNSGTSTVTISASHVENYTKNGITGNEAGTTVHITGNTVQGQGPTTGAAENSIQIGFGATGTVTSNVVGDDIWAPDTISDTGDAASGILVYASPNVTVSGNTVSSTQFGIVYVTDPAVGSADGGIIKMNKVSATHIFDGIDLCNNNNMVQNNTINGSDESGIHVDSSCTNFGVGGSTGSGDSISANTINGACDGIMIGTAAGVNSIGPNTFFNAGHTTATADQCTPPLARVRLPKSAQQRPFKPARP
jgi:parallel beta-helix repeat protein